MGVPGFFAWLVKKYPSNVLVQDPAETVHSLYLDWNGGIHPVCRSLLTKYKDTHASKVDIENEMLDEMLAYLRHVVSFRQPSELLYIAIDGVAPRAKMNQQRSRRFKAAKDKEITREIKRRHCEPLDYAWDTNAITPGTQFMNMLCARLADAIKTDAFFTNAPFRTTVSDARIPMEGEHKIVAHIRSQPGKNCVIYGLDADLIFLSLLSHRSHIWLMRERDQFGDVRSKKSFWFMDINCLKQKLVYEISASLAQPVPECQLLDDFVASCFLLGNDFLPKAPCLFIHEDGIDTLIAAYSVAIQKTMQFLTANDEINANVLSVMLDSLAEMEGRRLQSYHRKNHPRFTPRPSATPVEIELTAYDSIWPPPEDVVMLGKRGWKDRYYRHFFGIDRTTQRSCLNAIMHDYLKTMNWIFKYYTTGLPSWDWHYKYHHAPVLSDLAYYIKRSMRIDTHFTKGLPVQSHVQLLCVLPPQSFELIPPVLRERIESARLPYYPRTFDEDCIHKKKRWQSIAIIPFVDISRILSHCR